MESLHAMRVAGISEDLVDFRTALAAEDDRVRGQRLPPTVRNRSGLFYRRVASTGEQLRRLAAKVPRDQVHLYVFEDFRVDPRAVLNGILEFLNLSPLAAEDPIPVLNRRPGLVRGRALRTGLMAPQTVLLAKKVVPAPIRRTVRRIADAATLEQRGRVPSLSAPERSELLESFRADIELVSEFTGRDMWALWSGRPS
jgi:hypothetical protein